MQLRNLNLIKSFEFKCKKPIFEDAECWCTVNYGENNIKRFLAYDSTRHEEVTGRFTEYAVVHVTDYGAWVNEVLEEFSTN